MAFLYIILLGILQGVTEFLPVSSSGHVAVLEQLFGIQDYTGLPLAAFLHLGALIAIVWGFQKDVKKLVLEFLRIVYDIIVNIQTYLDNRKTGKSNAYRTIVHNNYRKLVVLLLVTSIPTAILGFMARNLAAAWGNQLLLPAIGFLISGVVLLVVDFIKKGNKIPKDMGYDSAMWIGICQGLSVFPGVSRLGLTMSAGMVCGLGPSFAVRYSILASVPAIIGGFFASVGQLGLGQMSIGLFFLFLAGMIVAAFVGMLCMRSLLRLSQKMKCRNFAIYNFLLGIVVLVIHFLR